MASSDIELATLTPESIQLEITQIEARLPEVSFHAHRTATLAKRKHEDLQERLDFLTGQRNNHNDAADIQNAAETPANSTCLSSLKKTYFCTWRGHDRCRGSTVKICLDYRSIIASVAMIALIAVLAWCAATGRLSLPKKSVFVPIL